MAVVFWLWGGTGALVCLIILLVVSEEPLNSSESMAAFILDKAVDSISKKGDKKDTAGVGQEDHEWLIHK